MKNAVLFFVAMAFAVGLSLPVMDGAEYEDHHYKNATEEATNTSEPLVEDDNSTEISGDFAISNNQSSDEFSGSNPEGKRSLTEDAPVASGSGLEGNVTETGSAILELPVDQFQLEEEEEEEKASDEAGNDDDDDDSAVPEGEDKQDGMK